MGSNSQAEMKATKLYDQDAEVDTDNPKEKWAITHTEDPDTHGFLLLNGVVVGRIYNHCPDIASVLAKLNA